MKKFLILLPLSTLLTAPLGPLNANCTNEGLTPRTVAGLSFEELLDRSVTVASRSLDSFTQAPSSITVFTHEDISRMGVRHLEDLLNFVPGMQSPRDPNRSGHGLSARGRRGQEPTDILFLLDGYRLNDDFSGSALIFNRMLSTGNIRQVEVIRGPGSALYGANAFLGVVNLVTRTHANELFVGVGEDGAREGHAKLSTDLGGFHGSLFIAGLGDDGETYPDATDPARRQTRDPREKYDVYATLEGRGLRLNARYAEFRFDDFYLFDNAPSSPQNRYYSRDTSANLSYRLVDNARGSLAISAAYRNIDHASLAQSVPATFMRELAAIGVTTGTQALLAGPSLEQTEYTLGMDGIFQLDASHRLFAGISYRSTRFDRLRNRSNYDLEDFAAFNPTAPTPVEYFGGLEEHGAFGPEGSTWDNLGIYIQDKYRIDERWNATLGLRYDHYSIFGGTFSPRLALVYGHGPRSIFKLLYGEAFRAPTMLEYGTSLSPVSIGNPNLDPEKIRTLELAWLQHFGHLYLTLTGFHSRLSDLIVPTPLSASDPRGTRINAGTLDLSGIEIELAAEVARGLTLRANLTHMFNLEDNPRQLARNLASLILNYHEGDWNLNLNGYYHGDAQSIALPDTQVAGGWVLNANLRYALDDITLVGTVYNLLDEDKRSVTRIPIAEGGMQRGRGIRIGMELTF